MKQIIEEYKEKIKRLTDLGNQHRWAGYSSDAIRVEVNIYRDFIKTLEQIQREQQKTETTDSILLDKFEEITKRRDDVLMSWDHEDGYFVSIVERGSVGQVADNDTGAKRHNIRDAIQAAIDYKPIPYRFR